MPFFILSIVILVILFFSLTRLSIREYSQMIRFIIVVIGGFSVLFFAFTGRLPIAMGILGSVLWLCRQNHFFESKPSQKPCTSSMTYTEALEILGLDATPNIEAINSAYKKLIKKNHPDKGGSDWLAARINEAYNLLVSKQE